MADLTHDKTYRFLMLLFMAVIALSSILVVLELQRPKVIEVRCEDKTQYGGKPRQVIYRYYSDGSSDVRLEESYGCLTGLYRKFDGTTYPYPAESTTTLP